MDMQRKRLLIAVLTFSMLLSTTGCGMAGRFMRAFGRVLEKRLEAHDAEVADARPENEENQKAEIQETEDQKAKDQEAENLEEMQEKLQEELPKKSPAIREEPREGVIGFDEIFSGGGSSEGNGQEEDGYDLFGEEDDLLSYDEFVAANLEKCKEDLAADKGSVQSQVDSDTVQWMNATYALITENNKGDRTLVGGMERNTINAVFMRYQLYTGWGVEDSESADKTIEWLRSEGHRQGYMEYVAAFEEMGLLFMDEEEFDRTIKTAFGELGSYTLNVLKTIYRCYNTYGEKGILAWDLCRINQVASWCYVAGYYTLDEALEIQYQNSLLLQESFSSWDDMMGSYLYGFQYWKGDSDDSSFSDTAKRRNIYNSLKEIQEGPYSGDFKRELQRSWKVTK